MRIPKLCIVLLALLMLVGCGQDPVQDDLINYINNETQHLAQQEHLILKEYESIIGKNYNNDAEAYKVITESIMPKYNTFVLGLESVQPRTAEVRELHELYISAANKQYNALVQLSSALINQDSNLLINANEKISEGRREIREYQYKISELAQKHNVKIE